MATSVESFAATLADNLGDIQAQIADLRAKEADIKAALAKQGVSPIEGAYFRVTVSHIDGRDVTDWETIAKRFNPSRQLIAAHTKTGAPSTRILCKARKAT